MSNISNKSFWTLFIIIIFFGFFLRFYALDMKLMHHDEAVLLDSFIKPMLNSGRLNSIPGFHGLVEHYITAPFVKVFGISLFSLRFACALFGSLTIILLYFLRKEIGDTGVLVSSAFLALSPTFVYYSRQYMSYPFYTFFLLLFIIVGVKLIKQYSQAKLYVMAILFAILINTNDAFWIFLFILLAFFYIISLFDSIRLKEIKDYLRKIDDTHLFIAVLILIFVFVLLQTSFFANFSNLAELRYSLSVAADKSVTIRHYHDFLYYPLVLIPIEIGLMIMLLLGIFSFKDRMFSKFLVFWSLASAVLFSFIGYKSNWIIPVIIFPWILLAGDTADNLFSRYAPYKKIFFAIIVLLLSTTLFFCITENYFIYSKSFNNHLGYLETSTDVLEMKKDIDAYAGGRDISILIMADRPHPLPYYLNGYNITIIRLLTSMPDVDVGRLRPYDVIIIHKGQFFNVSGDYEIKEFFFKEQDADNSKVNVLFRSNLLVKNPLNLI